MSPACVAVVLAAGAGSRFAGPTHKLVAPWGSSTVIAAATAAPVEAGMRTAVVWGAIDVARHLPADVQLVHNPDWVEGMASSLQAAVRWADAEGADALVVGLGDEPLIGSDAWRRVADAAGGPIVVAGYGGELGRPARLDRSVWALLPTTGDTAAGPLIRDRPDLVTVVECDGDPGDVDTVDDLDRWSSRSRPTDADVEWVTTALGRRPQSRWTVTARDGDGRPSVIENEPFLEDGTPMPTRFWLVDPVLSRRVGTLEAAGGVDRAESALGLDVIDVVHAAAAAERAERIGAEHVGPRPTGGVGGTRRGVKCLHAHLAAHLAGVDDAVGRWVVEQLETEQR